VSMPSTIFISLQDPRKGDTPRARHVALGVPMARRSVLFLAQPGFDDWAGHDTDDPDRWTRCHVIVAHREGDTVTLRSRPLTKVNVFWLPNDLAAFHADRSGVRHEVNGLTAAVIEIGLGADEEFDEENCGGTDSYAEPREQLADDINELLQMLDTGTDPGAPVGAPAGTPDPMVIFSFSICWLVPWCLP
jgi:hypothetical protein